MTGRELYEKWLELRGLPALTRYAGADQAAWTTLDFHQAEAWNDLADFLAKERG